ncbi:MAG: response regulator [Alphaproteobacteria bacterium]|nr:response regulator [Alphaproteobacteria bacterium]
MNYTTSILILVLVLDWLMFFILFGVGTVIGFITFISLYQDIIWQASASDTILAMYMYAIVYLLATLFARNKEMYSAKIILIKDKLNEKLEEEVIKRTNKLEESVNEKTYFLNHVNHEIRTPVQIITNISSNLAKEWDKTSEKERKELASQVNKSSTKLFSLINNVLDISKFESGRMIFDMKVHNMEDTTKNVIEELKPLADEKNIKIEFYKNKHIETRALYDEERISQTIRNLITNSIKYTNNKGHIRVDLKQKYATLPTGITVNGLCIAVKDDGIGIPKNELKKIFEPFRQSSKSKYSKTSTGLGLSICAEIVAAHNGVLWAESNNNKKGSIFYCVIPYPNNRIDPNEDKSEKAKINILFVDDEEGCRIAGRMILENIGYSVKLFSSGMDLKDYLEYTKNKTDLILLDMIMPDIEGIELVRQLREEDKHKDIPIIMQTGVKYDSELIELEKYKPIGYISKPYNKEELQKEVEKYLSKKSK